MPRRCARAWPIVALLLVSLACAAHRARPVRVGLALGSGGARGFAHVGVIRALEEGGIPIDLVAGSSVGSLIGALYADRPDALALESAAGEIERDDLFDLLDWSPWGLQWGLNTGRTLERFVRAHVRVPALEQLVIPFVAVAADVETGEAVVLDRGPVAAAVHASCAIPGFFRPVRIEGRLLVDGGVVDPVPVSTLRARGADVVIAVDVSPGVPDGSPRSAAGVTLRSITILMGELARERAAHADVVIRPVLSATDFGHRQEMIGAGLAAGREALPRIREAMARARARSGPTRRPAPAGARTPAAGATPPG